MITSRRRFFLGAAATLVVAPSIVRASSLMPISVPKLVKPQRLILVKDIIGIPDGTWTVTIVDDGYIDLPLQHCLLTVPGGHGLRSGDRVLITGA